MTDLESAQAFYENYCAMWREVGALAPEDSIFRVRQLPDMLLIRSNLPRRIPHMILDPLVDGRAAHEWVAFVVQQFADAAGSLMVGIPPGEEQTPLVHALEAEGFVPSARPLVAMARSGPVLEGGADGADEVRAVRTDAELAEARALLARVFGLPVEVFAFYTPPSLVRTYLLRQHGEPIAAMCLCPFAGYAGIYSVAVIPSARGRGHARRLVRTAIADAAGLGLPIAVLSCERHLIGLYRSLGFAVRWELAAYWLEAWWR